MFYTVLYYTHSSPYSNNKTGITGVFLGGQFEAGGFSLVYLHFRSLWLPRKRPIYGSWVRWLKPTEFNFLFYWYYIEYELVREAFLVDSFLLSCRRVCFVKKFKEKKIHWKAKSSSSLPVCLGCKYTWYGNRVGAQPECVARADAPRLRRTPAAHGATHWCFSPLLLTQTSACAVISELDQRQKNSTSPHEGLTTFVLGGRRENFIL